MNNTRNEIISIGKLRLETEIIIRKLILSEIRSLGPPVLPQKNPKKFDLGNTLKF